MQNTSETNLQGVDVDIETSLKEYGIAWRDAGNEMTFVYGIRFDGFEFVSFCECSFDKNVNVKEEFNWISESDWKDFASFAGFDLKELEEMPLEAVIPPLVNYFGTENIFGTIYFDHGKTFEEVL